MLRSLLAEGRQKWQSDGIPPQGVPVQHDGIWGQSLEAWDWWAVVSVQQKELLGLGSC